MASVTQRIKMIKQPKGGYVNPHEFNEIVLDDGIDLYSLNEENVHASLIGLVVDYLTRFLLTKNIEESFAISILGSNICSKIFNNDDYFLKAYDLLSKIKCLDNDSIVSACNLVQYDVYFRTIYSKLPIEIVPNEKTIHNIKTMVQRSLDFFADFDKEKIKTHLIFKGGYTSKVDSGDGDFMTQETLWDFKVSIKNPTKDHVLQILMYWLMGLHSDCKEGYLKIKYLGFFNPRLNKKYLLEVNNIDQDVIIKIEKEVIGY